LYRITILLALLVFVVAACTTAEVSTSDEASEPTASAEATPEPTPEESDEPTDEAEPSLSEGAGDLDDVLPDEVGGLTIEYQHSSGADVIGAEGVTPEAQAFFDRVGADPSDLSSAFGFAFDAAGSGSGISIVAFRVEGADEGTLRTEFLATMTEAGDTLGREQTMGGKTVQVFGSDPASPDGYIYVHDDTVFIVGGEPASLVEEALAALP
jgi:hypothetical protein